MDYLDAMIEARDKELSLWIFKYNVNLDSWEYYRDGVLIERIAAIDVKSYDLCEKHLSELRDRAVMEAAYKAAHEHLAKERKSSDNLILASKMLANYPNLPRNIKWVKTGDNLKMEPIQHITKISVERKFDWLAINRDASGY